MSDESKSAGISAEEKWDHSLENMVRKTTIGFVIGIIPALLFARSPAARGALVAVCTGIGSGMAYGEARYLFDYDVTFDKRHLIQVQLASPAAAAASGNGASNGKHIE